MNKNKRKLNKSSIASNTLGYLLCIYIRDGYEICGDFTVGEKYLILKADRVGFVIKDNHGSIRGEACRIPLYGVLWEFSRCN